MKALFLEHILKAMGETPSEAHENVEIIHVTRELSEAGNNTVYFRVKKGRRLDGNRLKKHINFFIVTDEPFSNMEMLSPYQIIMVKDVFKAFYAFTSYYRHLFDIPVAAITGTCGKTSVKEMLKYILNKEMTVQATKSNKNANCYNLPYLLGIDENTDAAVFETAIARRGDMMEACRYFFPTIGIFTMIGIDHTDKISTFEAYITEKAKLMEGLQNSGTLIINSDDKNIMTIDFSGYSGKLITYGKKESAFLQIKEIRYENECMKYKLSCENQIYEGTIPGLGEHCVYNAAAAITAAMEMGVDIQTSISRLETFTTLKSRFQLIKGKNDMTIIDDTWKSNPASLESGLKTLNDLEFPSCRKIAVLGRIAALGKYADSEYERIGKLAAQFGIDKLITKGSLAKDLGKAAISAGMKKENVFNSSDPEDILEIFDKWLLPGDIVYFKTGGDDEAFETFISYLK
ncbi:UDP-N-acetylmuramoyl-tripeptide--D-alanyl-D-alanine ligase [Bacillus sp. OV322]|uniref:Mur ligase family protein n=1 Tax=Bacillus sp. OV322 TaxID=1882764 RepID=UPI0008E04BF4|nr:UDP-N-acetylmuramoyl-tripeptide--D-alanyl-D-alanine ligase [Bacillus sp. OV322]SFC71436.1 UDP-N-acetylmuramoyl-tripeptide--D-alanyl-D-alanine ligase [Bacillus sp. OV322]